MTGLKRILSGRFSDTKISYSFELAGINKNEFSKWNRVLWIVPTRRYRTLLERHWIEYCNQPAVFTPQIISIDEWLLSQSNSTHPLLKYEKRWQRHTLIQATLNQFPDLVNHQHPGAWVAYFEESIRIWESFWLTRPTYNDIETILISELNTKRQDRIRQFANFYFEYLKLSESLNLVSRERVHWYFKTPSTTMEPYETVIVFSPDEWQDIHWDCLIQNLDSVQNSIIVLDYDEKSDSQPLHLKSVYSKLLSYGYLPTYIPSKPLDEISLSECKSVFDEVAQICTDIDQLLKAGVQPRDIAIVLKKPDRYLAWFQSQLKSANISYNYSAGYQVSDSTIVQLFLLLISLCTEDASLSKIIQWCQHPLINDYHAWKGFQFVANQLSEAHTLNDWKQSISLIKDGQAISESANFRDLNAANNQLNYLISIQNSVSHKTPFKEIVSAYLLGIIQLLPVDELKNREKVGFESWLALNKLLDDPFDWLSRHDLKPYGIQPEQVIISAVSELKWNEPVRNGIQILGPKEVIGRQFHTVFVPGSDDKVFPTSTKKQSVFNHEESQILEDYATLNRVELEYQEFHSVLSGARHYIHFTYSNEEQGSYRLQSLFVSECNAALRQKSEPNRFPLFHTGKIPFQAEILAYIDHCNQNGEHTPFDGLISASFKPVIRQKVLNDHHELSVTQLEKFSICGQQYLFEQLLELDSFSISDGSLPAQVRGLIIHQILYKFIQWVSESGYDITSDEDKYCYNQLFDIASDVVSPFINKSYHYVQVCDLQRLMDKNISPLNMFYEVEKIWQTIWQPSKQEYAFGEKSGNPLRFNLLNDQVRIGVRGQIDRIDVNNEGHAMIIDYKTGLPKNLSKQISHLKHLQLPVYTFAASQLLNLNVGGAFLYPVRRIEKKISDFMDAYWGIMTHYKVFKNRARNIGEESGRFEDITQYTHAINRFADQITQKANELISGQFYHNATAHLEDEGLHCPVYCSYQFICRKQPERIENLFQDSIHNPMAGLK